MERGRGVEEGDLRKLGGVVVVEEGEEEDDDDGGGGGEKSQSAGGRVAVSMMVVWCEGRIGMCLFAILSMILPMTVVSVNGQQVPCPPRCLCFKTTVRCMFLSMDKVPPIPAETTILDLRFNRIKEIPPDTFKNLSKLHTLLLNNNQLSKLQNGVFNGLQELRYLYLYKNKLKEIEDKVFQDLNKLEQLYLHFNKIEKLSSGIFSDMTNLERLFLHSNKLKHISPGAFNHLDNLKRLRLDSNALVCDCEMMWLAKLLQEKRQVTQAAATCQFPTTMEGRSLAEINDNDFHCTKPKITEEPRDVEISFGGTVFLTCRAEGDPQPKIVWMRDSNELNLADPRYTVRDDGTLMISPMSDSDLGVYECMAKNPAGEVKSRTAKMIYNKRSVLPTFVNSRKFDNKKSGSLARLRCVAEGSPAPVITWFKDGNTVTPGLRFSILEGGSTLEIRDAKESDSGLYTCLAQNQVGSAESNADVRVKGFGSRPPRILLRPYPILAPVGTSIELPCKADGDPVPVISWTRDGVKIATDKTHKISPLGSLRLYNISLQDSGLYSCIATNTLGEVFADGTLSVEDVNKEGAPGDRFATLAFQEASTEVDRAVNATIQSLFSSSSGPPTPYSLMRILRFPDATSRGLARAADVFERTLVNIKKHVIAGLKVNLTQDFEYKDLLSPSVVQTLANMSGCMTHQKSVNCSDMCFHSKYRTIEGTCNNLQHPMWGASLTGFRRLLKPIYENGFSTPVGWTKGVKYFGFEKPSARLVSTEIISTDSITPDTEITHMVMQWGQFLDHDIDHAIPSTSLESWEGLDCKKTCAYSAPCFPMEVPENDPRIHNRRCMDFIRSSAICGSGLTSVFFDTMQPREQINQLTAFIDGSQVYGFTEERSRLLRELSNDYGLLRIGITSAAGKAMLPVAGSQEVDCRRDVTESNVGCFLAGDIRVNEQVRN
ncbi:hypothetical protein LSTR_LSTR015502 [Laodelphax striatellus]|uniref:Ig-like domain-containing protein n=1 Tax=Laodelphax striatellus TaxID=195883 RepID=A0A482WKN7_LAOST|nr:hypothetical protein LSTR_LSTR015502 [Laodelphax striatellus]